MANACAACGGMGYGYIHPKFGFVESDDPCPQCNEGGEFVAAASGEEVVRSVDFVDDPGRKAGPEAGLTTEEAVAAGIFDAGEVEAQAEADSEAAAGAEAGGE